MAKELEPQGLFLEYPEEERLVMLRDNCDAFEKQQYVKRYSEEEVTEFKHILSEKEIQLSDIADRKAEFSTAIKAEEKPVQEEKKNLVTKIKHKSELVTGEVFKFIDHEAGRVTFHSADGMQVDSRPIMNSERQTNVHQILRKNGTNE